MSDAVNAALITQSGQLLNTGLSAAAASNMNRRTQRFNVERYNVERADALADWTRQNEYNSPSAQMARFRDAGLNPALIYGQQNTSDAVRSTNTAPWNPRAPNIDLNPGAAVSAFYDVRLKEAQIDNLRAQNTVSSQEAILKAAQTAGLNMKTATDDFSLQQAKRLADISAETAAENLRKITTDIDQTKQGMDISAQDNARRAATTAQSLQQGLKTMIGTDLDNANKRLQSLQMQASTSQTREQTQSIRQQREKTEQEIRNLKSSLQAIDKDNAVRDLDIDLKKKGIQPGDQILLRTYFYFLNNLKKAGKAAPKPGTNWNMVTP